MIELPEPPTLTAPSCSVKTSYLVGEQADMVHRGSATDWLRGASMDFDAYVAERTGVRERWGVPSELFWYTAGEYYIGSLVIRHRLTDDEGGGHIGYHVVYPWQRRGHATRMLGLALEKCAELGLERALLTVAPDNAASTTVVTRHGAARDTADGGAVNDEGEVRYWIDLSRARPLT